LKKICLLFGFLIGLSALAQNNELNLLLNNVKNAPEDSTKVNNLNALSEEYWQTGEFTSALTYAQEAKVLAEKIEFKAGEGRAFINTALIYWKQGDYPKALELAFYGLRLYEESGNQSGIARAHNCIGLIYFNQENYDGALVEYSKGAQLRESIGDTANIAGSFNNIGEVYVEKGDYDLALRQFENALKINQKYGNQNWAAINLNNIGNIYVVKAGQKNISVAEEMNNYQLAQKYYLDALGICQKIEDKQGIAKSYVSLGTINLRLKSYDEARQYFDNALDFSKRIGYKEAIKSSYGGLEKLDSTLGNWEAAYQNQKLFSLYSDSLINEENTRKSMYASMNFAFEKKETALKNQQKEEKRQQFIIIISVSVGFVFALVLAFIILRSLRRNQKQNKIITAQKELVEKQKQLVEEKQKEISDSINYAERIQRSFMATADLLTNNLPDHFVFFQPKDVVSGDFYWAANLPNGSFLLATADSTGHGVPGAIMSILNISCLENAVEEKQLIEPAEILNHTRTKIIERLKKDGSAEGGKDGMDCSLIRFDLPHHQLVYAAANNPIWIVRQTDTMELIELAADRKPVGKGDKDKESFTQHTVQLQKNDIIYTITDGLPDQFGGPRGKKFLYKQLKEFLLSIANLPLEQQKMRLKEAFLTWKGDLEQVDDICIIGVRI
jgi:serine phosphatase RsbU (regulator of sigma subunit)